VLRPVSLEGDDRALRKKLFAAYQGGSFAEVTRLVLQEFPGQAHKLDDLFLDEQRRIIGIVLKDRVADYQRLFERLADEDEDVLALLGRLRYPLPKPILAAARVCLDGRLAETIGKLETEADVRRIKHLLERGGVWGYRPDYDVLHYALGVRLRSLVREIEARADLSQTAERLGLLLDVSHLLGMQIDLWQAQNQLLNAYTELTRSGPLQAELSEALVRLAERLNMAGNVLGWKP
jgi:hypothetical protein